MVCVDYTLYSAHLSDISDGILSPTPIFIYFMALTRKNMSVSKTSSTTPCSGLVGSVTITHPQMIDLTDINSALCLLLEQTF